MLTEFLLHFTLLFHLKSSHGTIYIYIYLLLDWGGGGVLVFGLVWLGFWGGWFLVFFLLKGDLYEVIQMSSC